MGWEQSKSRFGVKIVRFGLMHTDLHRRDHAPNRLLHFPKGHAAALKKNVQKSMINLIGAMSEKGMSYYKLLNQGGEKKDWNNFTQHM